jgi:ribosome maturation factor RimP
MSKAPTPDVLARLLEPVVAGSGVDLEEVELTPAGKRRLVRVVVAKDGGISLDDVAAVASAVSSALDEGDVMGTMPYVLEVSSPGVDRPLTQPRHWRRATGRLVTAVLAGGGETTGRVRSCDDDGVTLDVDGTERTLAWGDVVRGRVQVEFRRPDGRPRRQPRRRRDSRPRRRGGVAVDIDMGLLRSLERERDIRFDLLVEAIEQSLLVAYQRTAAMPSTPASSSTAPTGTSPSGRRRWTRRASCCASGTTPHRLRPDRGDHRQAGDHAAPARGRGRRDVRRVRRQGGRHRLGRRPAGPQRARRARAPRAHRGDHAAAGAGSR